MRRSAGQGWSGGGRGTNSYVAYDGGSNGSSGKYRSGQLNNGQGVALPNRAEIEAGRGGRGQDYGSGGGGGGVIIQGQKPGVKGNYNGVGYGAGGGSDGSGISGAVFIIAVDQ